MTATDSEILDYVMSLPVPTPLAVVRSSECRLVGSNTAFAGLLGVETSQTRDLDISSLVPEPEFALAEVLLAGLANGMIESCRARSRLRRRGLPPLPVVGWIGRLRSGESDDLALAAVMAAQPGSEPAPLPLQPLDTRIVMGSIDHDWRLVDISVDAEEIFGWDLSPRGEHVLGVIHPDDAPALLLAMGRCRADQRSAGAHLRLKGRDGHWPLVWCEVSPWCEHSPPRYALTIRPELSDQHWETPHERVSRLETLVWKLVLEARAAGIDDQPEPAEGAPGQDAPVAVPILLSARELQLLELAALGLSNKAIADRLILSLNTVRSQFQAVLKKLGAHSKLEAVAIARSRNLIS